MKVAVIGSRKCEGLTLETIIAQIPRNCTLLLSGGAEGVDQMVRTVAAQLDIHLIEFLPDYEKYQRNAPLVRNQQMVKEADLVFAFWDMSSRGTADAIAHCIKEQIPIHIIPINGLPQSRLPL